MSLCRQTPAAAALGLFDGVHLGHRAVLNAALRQAAQGLRPAVFTFPAESALRKGGGGYLYPTDVRNALLHECGFAKLTVPDFSEVCGMDGKTFVRSLLCEQMGASYVCCGADFRFGRGAAWNAQDLCRLGKNCGIYVEVVPDVTVEGVRVSSTDIRKALQAGEIESANRLLGAPYRICQTISHGAHLGSTIGFATINQVFAEGQLVPKFGVYASQTRTPDGWRDSITNIGVKPTVDYSGAPLAETHILDFEGDLYGETLPVILTAFLRTEQRFDSLDALTAQLGSDIRMRRQLSNNYHNPNT